MITLEDYFGSHTLTSLPDQATKDNALDLLSKVNALLREIDLPEAISPKVNSGWRPAHYNVTIPGAALRSKHITGQAIDLADPEGALDDYLFNHPELLIQHGLFMEHPLATKNWQHLQSVSPRSGRRIFFP